MRKEQTLASCARACSNHRSIEKSYNFEAVLLELLDTQINTPSKAIPCGLDPTRKLPWSAPSLARSLVALLVVMLVTQMYVPSKATPAGEGPAGKVFTTLPELA